MAQLDDETLGFFAKYATIKLEDKELEFFTPEEAKKAEIAFHMMQHELKNNSLIIRKYIKKQDKKEKLKLKAEKRKSMKPVKQKKDITCSFPIKPDGKRYIKINSNP